MKDTYETGTKYYQGEKIMADPHVYNDGAVPGSIRIILNSMDEISQQFADLSSPYLLFQSGVDKMVDPFAPLDLE